VLFATFMAIVAFVLSLGPKLTVDGTTRKLSFRLPYSYLSHVKLVNDLLPVRFSLYSALFTAVVLAHGIDACRESIYARAYRTKLRSSGPSWRGTGVFLGRTIAVVLLGASFISLVPRLPFPSTPYSPPWGSDVAALSGISAGGNVLTYPYAGSFTSDAMGWQAEDNFGFKLFGSYILRPGVGRRATPLAAELSPLDVEAMLTDTLTPIAIPGLPYLAPSAHTIMATRIVVLGRHSPLLRDSRSERRSSAGATAPGGTAGAAGPGATGHAGEVGGVGGGQPLLVGTVENVDYATGAFYVFAPHSLDLTGVTVSAKTRYVESRLLSESPTHVLRAMHVAVYGKVIAGTLTPGRIVDLRTFLRVHHVAGIIVQLGRVDSTEVVRYVEDAIGPPTHRLAGGDIWSRVPLRLEGYTGRPVLARRQLSTTAVEKASTQA